MASQLVSRSKTSFTDKQLRRQRLRRILLENLDRRELLAGDLISGFSFAEDASMDYITSVIDSVRINQGEGNSAAFNATSRWTDPVGGPSPNEGDQATITWSIVPDGTVAANQTGGTGAPSNLVQFMDDIYGDGGATGPLSERPWFGIFERAYDRWSELSGLNFVYEAADDGVPQSQANRGIGGVRGDVRIAGMSIDGTGGILAYNFFPSNGGNAGLDGDMVIDTNDANFQVNADPASGENRYLGNVVMHEAGHGVGLGHAIPVNQTKLMEPNVTTAFFGPQHDDILGAHKLYGDAAEPDDGPGAANDLGMLGNGLVRVTGNSLDADGDTDYIRFSIPSAAEISIDLEPVGEQYNVGNQGGSTSDVDSTQYQDLSFRVLDGAGNELINVSATGLGEIESLVDFALADAGDYLIQVDGVGVNPQLYDLALIVDGISSNPDTPPRLLSVSPNVGEIFSFNRTNDLFESPNELVFRFDSFLDAASFDGIRIVRSGDDGDLADGDEVVIEPGWIGFGESDRIVIARFESPLVDDLYGIEVFGVDLAGEGISAVTATNGLALQPRIDGTDRDSLRFDLELGAKIVAVVPQPVVSNPGGTVSQARDQIEVYFNNDDLHATAVTTTGAASDPTVVQPDYYQLILTEDSVTPGDDTVFMPTSVSYDPDTDKAVLTFASDIDQLAGGDGTFRLRIGSNTPVDSALNPPVVTALNPAADPNGFLSGALSLNGLFDADGKLSTVVSESLLNVQNQLFLDFPGSNFEPGHRDIQDQTHVGGLEDDSQFITQAFYNFALDRSYGLDTFGQPVFTSITPEQIDRVREIYEFYGAQLGIDFVETESLGMTVVVGDPAPNGVVGGPGGVLGVASVDNLNGLAIMDGAEAWLNELTLADGPGGQFSFFGTALHEVGHMLGIGHTYELPDGTIMGSTTALSAGGPLEEIFPGDHDIVHASHGYRPDNKDVDLYRFDVPAGVVGNISIETTAERLANSSNADTHLTLLRQGVNGLEVVATNNDYFSSDSLIRTELSEGTYFIGVTAFGNQDFDPATDDTGSGGVSQGDYELRVDFEPQLESEIVDVSGSAIDGDGDGLAGGDFNFWFRAAAPIDVAAAGAPKTVFVNKDFSGASTGSATQPFRSIPAATAAVTPGDIIRIAPTLGNDGDVTTVADNPAYEIGRGGVGNAVLADGIRFEVPQGVTAMIDAGAIFKMGGSRIVTGSRDAGTNTSFAALQILGTPEQSVVFTSINDESFGIDTNPIPTVPQPGQWGGLEFHNDVDRAEGRGDYERDGIFISYVGQADIRYGGGAVTVATPSPTINPIHLFEARPTILNNTIRFSSDSAMSADPDSFEETRFTEPRYQLADTFNSDYDRVGPDIRGNVLLDNTINGLFVRVATAAGGEIDTLDVQARFDDTDITHVLGENLIIAGTPGGAFLETTAPDTSLITFDDRVGTLTTGDTHTYIVTFFDLSGAESIPSAVSPVGTVGADGGLQLNNLPAVTGEFVGRRIYRSANGGVGPFTLVAAVDGDTPVFVDAGQDLASTLANPTATSLQRARLDARLAIDPGIVIKSLGSRIEVGIGAQLIAEGNNENRVIFTSRRDDRYGAGGTFDTNNDGNSSGPAPGDWGGLNARHFSSISVDSALVTFGGGVTSVAGGFAGFNAIEIHQADARIANSILEDNASGLGGSLSNTRDGRGNHDASVIFVRGSQPVLINNVIQNNSSANTAAISIDANSMKAISVQDGGRQTGDSERLPGALGNMGPLVSGNRLALNGLNGMRIRGKTLTTEAAWDDTDIVHVLQSQIVIPDFHSYGGLRLQSKADESLVVKLGSGASIVADGLPLDITDRIGGSLQVIGTPGFPVIMTSLSDDSVGAGFDPTGLAQVDTNSNGLSFGSPGDWTGITLNPSSNDRNLDTITELESDSIADVGVNDDPLEAQPLGALADAIGAGDENLRLGFTVHGVVASTADLDVYSFVGTGGTTVWLDIDRTDAALDSVIELVDGDGNIIAQSNDSLTESENGAVSFVNPAEIAAVDVNTFERNPFAPQNTWSGAGAAKDFQSTNPADAGMRVVLPGVAGAENEYFIRVRSSNVAPGQAASRLQDPSLDRAGLTRGAYRLQVRMQQDDEVAGSTIRYADIRFATNGIQAIGLPAHSQLLGTTTETVGAGSVETPASTVNVGNIANSDRAGVSIGGELESAGDVDWYRFSVGHTQIQSGDPHVSTSFDIDYADGYGRANTSLWVYKLNENGAGTADDQYQLILIGSDSDIADDRPAPTENGGDVDDLSRGSFGTKDAFIGAQELLPGEYIVAVTNNSLIANQLQQFHQANPVNPDLRIEPIDSVQRISVDRFDNATHQETAIGPQSVAFNGADLEGTNAVPWTLADVTTFFVRNQANGSRLFYANAMTGAVEAQVGADFARVNDLAISPDGRLVGYEVNVTGQENDANSGNFFLIDSAGDGATVSNGNHNIQTLTTEQTGATTFVIRQRTVNNAQVGSGFHFEGLTFYSNAAQVDTGNLSFFGVGHRGTQRIFNRAILDANNAVVGFIPIDVDPREPLATNYIYKLDPTNGSVINPANVAGGQDRQGNFTTGGAGTADREFWSLITADPFATVTGLSDIKGVNGALAAVSDQGELYLINAGNGVNRPGGQYVNSIGVIEDGGAPVAFSGLTAGPANLEGGRFASLLFGTTNDGTIYAIDPFDAANGFLANVFPGGNFKIKSDSAAIGAGVLGLEFSPLDVNLWHTTDTRDPDSGHGRPATHNNLRPDDQEGDNSIYFGFENADDDGGDRQQGDWDPIHTVYNNSYNLPGGAHGAVESLPLDLSEYGIDDVPMLYFNYYLATQNQNSDITDGDTRMQDAFRTYAAGDDGQWILLSTNNSDTSGNFNSGEDEFDIGVSGYFDENGNPLSVQEAFDIGDAGAPDNWRQIRASLQPFAGHSNVKIRFEFSTGASFRTGNPLTGGEELTAIPGWEIADGDTFTIETVDQGAVVATTFEFDHGLVLDLPGGASIEEGDAIEVDGTTFTFSLTSNAGNDILFLPTDSPAAIAAKVAAKMTLPTTVNAIRANILNIDAPDGSTNSVTGLPAATIVGLPGAQNGGELVKITQADDAVAVRDAIRGSLAANLNIAGQEANIDVWSVYGETIRLFKYSVTDAGPLKLVTQRIGDFFGVDPFGGGLDRMDERAQNNTFEGLFIDDVIVGLAERGEAVVNSPTFTVANNANNSGFFSANADYEPDGFINLVTGAPVAEAETGRYQLDIRTAADYATTVNGDELTVFGTAGRTFDSNDRLAPGIGFTITDSSQIADGDTLTLSDGVDEVIFEFDVTTGPGDRAAGTAAGTIPIPVLASDSTAELAVKIRDAINGPSSQLILDISASVQANSSTILLHGPAALSRSGNINLTGLGGVTTQVWGAETGFGEDHGDSNRRRDQGVVLINSTFVSDSSGFGIVVDAAPRAGAGVSTPGAPINYPTNNADRLAPGVVLVNNVLDSNASGGIRISGDAFQPNAGLGQDVQRTSTIARVVNNTIYGADSGTGILVEEGASPIILNNILADNATGINVSGAQNTFTLGANFYFSNGTNVTPGGAAESFRIVSTINPFIDAAGNNFYLVNGSDAIDSSLNSLAELASLTQIRSSLGLPPSPTLAPDRDVIGQRRVDDPGVNSPGGLGANVFKDRGAFDRADSVGLQAVLQNPLDNDSENVDVDRTTTFVNIKTGTLDFFEVLLLDPLGGSGPDHTTVTEDAIVLTENGRRLEPGTDYIFGYNQNSRTLRFTPLSGVWRPDSVYEVTLNNRDGLRLTAPTGVSVADGSGFTVTVGGADFVFEWDSDGSVSAGATAIPFQQTYSQYEMAAFMMSALNSAGLGTYLQGDDAVMIPNGTVAVDALGNSIGEFVPAVRDVAGNPLQANRPSTLTQFTIVMPEVQLDYGDAPSPLGTLQANDGPRHALLPIDAPYLVLGAFADGDPDGSPSAASRADDNEVTLVASTVPGLTLNGNGQGLLLMPVPSAALDGQQILLTDVAGSVIFEFDTNGSTGASSLGVDISAATTADEVATALADAVNAALASGLIANVSAFASGATVDLGVVSGQTVDLSSAASVVRIASGTFDLEFTSGSFVDGQWIDIRDGQGQVIRFQLNDTSLGNRFVASPTLVPVNADLSTATTEQVVQAFADAINLRVAAGRVALGPSVASGTTLTIHGDDEEGVVFGGLLNSGSVAVPVTVTTSGSGILDVWVDWNGDGAFNNLDERIVTDMPVLAGENTFFITTPASAATGFTTTRFRLSTTGNLPLGGVGIGGEVEDHLVEVVQGAPPVVNDDSYSVNEDDVLMVGAPGVLANDTDADSASFTVKDEDLLTPGIQPLVNVTRGELLLAADGSFTYTPDPDFFGVDTFVYHAVDNRLQSGVPATVTINVNPINDSPTAIDDQIAINEDQTIVIVGADLTSNDFKGVEGTRSQTNELEQSLIVVGASIIHPNVGLFGGTVTVVNDQITFTPPANYNDEIDGPVLIEVTIQDNGQSWDSTTNMLVDDFLTDVSTLTINIAALNDSPEYNLPAVVTVGEDAGPQAVDPFITGIAPGPTSATDEATGPALNPENQTVAFTAVAIDPSLFASGPTIDAAGVLTYELNANVNNNAPFPPEILVEVTAVDSGSGEAIIRNLFDTAAVASGASYDGATLTVSDAAGNTVVFEFDDVNLPGVGSTAGVPHVAISYDPTVDTAATIDAALLAALNSPPPASIAGGGTWGVSAFVDSITGEIRLVGDVGTVSAAGPQINTLTNLFTGLNAGESYDGATFTIVDADGDSITFELNDTTDTAPATPGVTAGNSPIDYDPSGTQNELSQAISNAINNPDAGVLAGLAGTWDVQSQLPAGSDQLQLSGVDSLTLSASAAPIINPLASASLMGLSPLEAREANTAVTQTFTILVEPVNDAPVFDLSENPITVLEDAGTVTFDDFVINAAAGPPSAQDELASQMLTLSVVAVDPTSFAVQPSVSFDMATGTASLTFETATDMNDDIANNTIRDLSVIVTLMDDGGTAVAGSVDTTVQTLTISVTPVNDAPSFTLSTNEITVFEDNEAWTGSDPTVFAGFALDPTQGPATAVDETTIPATQQSLDFVTVSVSDPSLFEVQPEINAAGDLSFKTAADQNGTAVIVVRLLDDGLDASTGNGDDNQARPDQTFTINLTAVNDPPEITLPATVSSIEDQGLVQVVGFATNLIPGPDTATDETAQTFIVDVRAADPSLFVVQPAIAADGTLTYQTSPDVNSNTMVGGSPADLRVFVSLTDDGTAGPLPDDNTSVEQTFTVVVAPINDAPTFDLAQSQVVVIEDVEQFEGTTITTIPGVVANALPGPATATDELSQTLAFEVVSVSAPELFDIAPSLSTAGDLTFKTALHRNGDALVVIRLVDDGLASPPPNDNDSQLQTLTISVTPINDAPEFDPLGSMTVDEDAGLVSQNGFASNVRRGPVGTSDENSQQISFLVTATDPSAFTVQPAIAPDGTLSFQTAPNVNSLNANLEVTVKLVDNGLGEPAPNQNMSIEQTFTILVNPVNDPPIPDAFSSTTAEDTSLTINAADVLVGDLPGPVDEAAQSLQMTQIERTSANGGTIVPVFSGSEIVSFTYTPAANFEGTDSFLYVVTDDGTPARSGSGTIEINVSGVNDPPQFVRGANQIVPEDADLVTVDNWATGILAGPPAATDEQATQTVSFSASANTPSLFEIQPAIAADGTLTFKPNTDANGTAVVTVTATDDGSNVAPNMNTSAPQTFTITINPVNDAPVFTSGGDVTVAEDSSSYSQPWATSIAPAAGLLSNPPTANDEASQIIDFSVTNDQPGLFSVQPTVTSNGVLEFTPTRDAFGAAVVTVVAVDRGASGGADQNTSVEQTFTISITQVNDAPVAVADTFSSDENQILTVAANGVLANDTDVDLPDDSLSAVAANTTSALGAVVVVNADGSISYDPSGVTSIQQLSTGQSVLDTFTYQIQDEAGTTSAPATVTVNVAGVDDPPIAVDDSYSMGVGQTRLLDVLTNDSDVDSTIDPRTITITQLPISGTATVNQTGVIQYVASAGFRGVETLAYTVRDAAGNLSNEAVVTLTINNPPVAVNDSTFTFKGESVDIAVLVNDSDLDGTLDVGSVQIVAAPSPGGTAEVLTDGQIRFTPADGFSGNASFSYVVSDDVGTVSNVANVLVRVQNSRWQNPQGNLDVNADGFVSPIDALIVINYLNNGNETFLPDSGVVPEPFLDPSGDESVSPLDALLIINFLNSNSGGGGAEGEEGPTERDLSNEAYVMMVTPEQIMQTVGEQVVAEIRSALDSSLAEALDDATIAGSELSGTESQYGPILPGATNRQDGASGEADELLESIACSHEGLESSVVEQAIDELFANYGPQRPK